MKTPIAIAMQSLHAEIHAEIDRAHPAEEDFTTSPYTGRKDYTIPARPRSYKPAQRHAGTAKLLPGELPFKQFIAMLAARYRVNWAQAYNRVKHRHFAGIVMRRINQRIIFVREESLQTAVIGLP